MTASNGHASTKTAFSVLERLYADEVTAGIFSERHTVECWLTVEAGLARAQAQAGIISSEEAEQIAAAAALANVDLEELWSQARNVGYPILPLVRMIARALPAGPDGRVHYGATTQDIMDTALAMQLSMAMDRLEALIGEVGAGIILHIREHRQTVMAARTHAQQAVPTTFGAVMAGFLTDYSRYRARLAQARGRVCRISLHGGGGTSAAYGPHAGEVRRLMAQDLGLTAETVPWHVSRDGVAEFGGICAMITGTCARLAKEVVDLSRTEIGEISGTRRHHRGASSTMAQKANPVLAEAIIGMAGTSAGLASALYRAMEAGHERAAGEWQIEWQCLPQLTVLTASALAAVAEAVTELTVNSVAMQRNLNADGGAVMAEAYMMRLAGELGREQAHDLLYSVVQRARENGSDLPEELAKACHERGLGDSLTISPDDYLGETGAICDAALAEWEREAPVSGTGKDPMTMTGHAGEA